MEDSFIVAGYFNNSHEAHVFKTKLEAVGVESQVDFEHLMGSGFAGYSGLNGIRVRIKKSDLPKAQQLIAHFHEKNNDYIQHLRGEDILINRKKFMPWEGYCPNCDHDQIHMQKTPTFLNVLAVLTFGLFALFTNSMKKHCTNCKHFWRD